jgi:DNA repair exonuclease SbcCD ATPase subunit
MSRIVRLVSENIQKLRAIDITPPRNVVTIGGKNGEGKTSTLDSIAMALGGGDEICDMPVRRGETKAKAELHLDDGLVIRRTFTEAGGTALVIENADGARYPKPQDILNKLTGKYTFDPLAFASLGGNAEGRRKQLEQLRKLVNLDFTALDAQKKKLLDERSLVNKQAESAKAKADFMPHTPDAPTEEVSVTAIVQERDAAKEHNAKLEDLKEAVAHEQDVLNDAQTGRKGLIDEIEQLEKRLKSLREQVAEYDQAIPAITTRLEAAQQALSAFTLTDIAPINQKLANAELLNAKVRQNKARDEVLREAQSLEQKSEALTSQISEIEKQKAEQLAAVKFPIDGLSFDETGVLFNGAPFDQASDAEKIRISVAMGLALNPKLKVLLVRNASLLDADSLKLLTDLAIEADAQVWLEVVSIDADKCSVIIEDGAVKTPAVEESATA